MGITFKNIFLLVILTKTGTCLGLYMNPDSDELVAQRPPVPWSITRMPPNANPFKSVMAYYRKNSNIGIPDSFEANEDIEPVNMKKANYRIELSGDKYAPVESKVLRKKEKKPTTTTPTTTTEKVASSSYSYGEQNQIIMIEDDEEDSIKINHLSSSPNIFKATTTQRTETSLCSEGNLKRVQCNTCLCVDGNYVCSKKECKFHVSSNSIPHRPYSDIMGGGGNGTHEGVECDNGRFKLVHCNNCICALGKWYCTKRKCIPLSLREQASYIEHAFLEKVDSLKENKEMEEDCAETETRQIDCNQCICHFHTWQCTKLQCPPQTTLVPTLGPPKQQVIEEACQKEDDVKHKDCNLCACRRGFWVCTVNDCEKKMKEDLFLYPVFSFRSSSKLAKEPFY